MSDPDSECYEKQGKKATFKAAICMFGFLLPIRRLRDRIASFGCTVFDRIMSDISKLRAISSLLLLLV